MIELDAKVGTLSEQLRDMYPQYCAEVREVCRLQDSLHAAAGGYRKDDCSRSNCNYKGNGCCAYRLLAKPGEYPQCETCDHPCGVVARIFNL